jgi:hypothetical protein
MKTLLIIIGVLGFSGLVVFLLTKFGVFKDDDNDGIPDKVEEAAGETSRRAKRIKEELSDVGKSMKEVGSQLGDVSKAASGEKRKGRKPKQKTKKQNKK